MSEPGERGNGRARALALFDELVDAPVQDRAAAVELLRTEHASAAEYLQRLFAADATDSGLLGGAGADLLPGDGELTELASYAHGQTIGPYRLGERLGRGGMGEVWAAERSGEGFAQVVALKLLPPALGSGPAAARFRRERRILAGLEHPGIARFIDGGISPEGVPFLAMERIAGQPITRHVAVAGAGVEERLRLFAEVCDVVAYAHRALVVHRDLKPSNVLVTADGKVKLLDFGIAKLIDDEAPTGADGGNGSVDGTYLTRRDERVMTPAYAAPEQVRGDRVTTATDVWALGVLLYELLTGERPFAATDGSRAALEHQVLAADPQRPSSRLGRGETTTGISRSAVARRLRGDLDAIVLTALAKDPAQRYPSVDALAADVRAFLAGHPISVRPAGLGVRTLKFVRRHRVAVAAAAVALLAIAGGVTAALWQAREAAREGRRAEEVKAFLLRLFASASPEVSRGAQVTARELLDEGARQVDEIADDPALQVELYLTIGNLYSEIGLAGENRRLARRAVEVATRAFGDESREAFDAHLALADAAIYDDALPEARREAATLLDHAARLGRGIEDATVRAKAILARLAYEESKADEAVRLQREVVAALGKTADAERLAEEEGALADYLYMAGERAEVERIQRRVLAAQIARVGEMHPDVAQARHNLGITLARMDRHDEAMAELRQAAAIHRQVEGDSHPHLASSLREMAGELTGHGKYDAASEVIREGLEVARRARGERSFLYANLVNDRAIVAYHTGRFADAARDFQFAVEVWTAVLGPEHAHVVGARNSLAAVLERTGRLAEAEAASREVLAITRRVTPENDWLAALNTLGIVLRVQGRGVEAAALHREALSIATKYDGAVSRGGCYAQMLLGRALLVAGEVAAGAREADAALPCVLTFGEPESPGMAPFHLAVAEARLAEDEAEAALAALAVSEAIRRKNGVADSDPRMAELRLRRAEAYAALGRRDEARRDAAAAAAVYAKVYPPGYPLAQRAAALLARL